MVQRISSLFPIAGLYSISWICHNLFIHQQLVNIWTGYKFEGIMNDITINIHIQIYVLSYSFLSLRLRPKSRIQHFILKFFKSIGKVEEWYITYPLLQFSVGNSMPYLLYLSVSIKYFFMRHLVESCRHHDLLALNTSLPNNKAILLHNHNTITTKKTFFPTLF